MWGLALDEDNQQELTESRVINWVNQISNEFQFIALEIQKLDNL